MSDHFETPSVKVAWWAKFTLIGGILAALLAVLAPLGYRLGLLDVRAAVLIVPGMGVALGVVTLAFVVVGIVLTLRRGLRRDRLPLAVGGVLALAVVLNTAVWFVRANGVPPIHDITTDPTDPPRFIALREIRGPGTNPLDYDAAVLAEPTREAYPFVRPIETGLPAAAAFDRALELVRAFGWELVVEDPAAWHIEATATTRLYGFKDDVVIRVRDDDAHSRIDLRSVSRVGQSDLGANAQRIGAFIEAFEAR